jgi:hypothetical protein
VRQHFERPPINQRRFFLVRIMTTRIHLGSFVRGITLQFRLVVSHRDIFTQKTYIDLFESWLARLKNAVDNAWEQ